MQARPQPMGLLLPVGFSGEFGGEVRLPKGDVAYAPNSERRHQSPPLFLESGDLLGVAGKLILEGEVPLSCWYCPLAERAVKGLFHRVLKSAGVIRGESV